MGFDVAAIGLGQLFGFGDVAAVGGEVSAYLGFGAADAAAAGATDVGLGVGADAVAGTDAALGVGAVAADVGAGLGAADAFSGAGVVSGALESAGGGFATDTAAATAAGTGEVGASASLPGAGTIDAASALAGSQNIDATLGVESAVPTADSGVTTAAAAQAANPGIGGASPMGPGMGGATAIGEQVPAAAATEAAAPAGDMLSGIGDKAGSLLGNKAVQMGLPLGVLGYDLLKGPPPLPSNAISAINGAQQGGQNIPLFNQTAATDLNLANNFQISPAQAASINTWKQNQYNALYQQIANQGNANPESTSEWVQGKNQIDQQALSQQTQMVSQLITTAFQAAGAANSATSQMDNTLMQAAQLQIQQDNAFQQSVSSALQSFGLIAALSGKFGNSGATA